MLIEKRESFRDAASPAYITMTEKNQFIEAFIFLVNMKVCRKLKEVLAKLLYLNALYLPSHTKKLIKL